MAQTPQPPLAQRLRVMLKRTMQGWIGAADSAASFFRHFVWKNMVRMPPPPVPPRLREMLKDYPELIEEVQTELNSIVDNMLKKGTATPPFERAVWRLEDTLSHLRGLAQKDVRAAEAGDDPQALEKAKQKRYLIGRTRSARPWHDDGVESLWDYFQRHEASFK